MNGKIRKPSYAPFARTAVVLLLVLFTLPVSWASRLYDRLIALEGVVSVEELDRGFFEERYVVMFEQPLDHKNTARGKFEQRFIVAHIDFDRPTVMITEGYSAGTALNPRYREELSQRLSANQVFVEHRFFGESIPNPVRWDYLNAENACADLHRIRQAMADTYPEKWISAGVSKGGQNALLYRMYYPQDVDLTVAYVAPVCTAVEDGRHEPFLEQVGSEEDRYLIREFQTQVLRRRDEIQPLFDKYCEEKKLEFHLDNREILDLCVLEFPFSLWQWGKPVSMIPAPDASAEDLAEHLIAIAPPRYFSIQQTPSFFVQAAKELGYYGYDTTPFDGLMSVKNTKGYLYRAFLPTELRRLRFNDTPAKKLLAFLKENDPRLICIYGENDPWSAAMTDPALFEGKQNMKLVVEPGGSHLSRIRTQPDRTQYQIWKTIEGWVFGI